MALPEQMTAVVLDSYSGESGLRVETRPVPVPAPHQVLVKMAAAAINPSDLMFIKGLYGFKKPTPVVAGFEGAGVVVASGGSWLGRYYVGKRVATINQELGDGTWAEYMLAPTQLVLPLNPAVDLEQGAMSLVNPLTALALFEVARQGGHRYFIHTAAASALGQMLIRLSPQMGIHVLNIVRREEQVKLLHDLGAELVLNSQEPDFAAQLEKLCHEHHIRLAFDAVGGELTFQLLQAMPKGSKVSQYGGLAETATQVHPLDLIFRQKTLDGFWLTAWFAQRNLLQSLLLWRKAQKMMQHELKSEIRARYPLSEVQQALADYQQQMTGGKVIFRM